MLSTDDVKGVEATLDGMVATWNRNDMDGFEALLSEDCEWVNVVGAHDPNHQR